MIVLLSPAKTLDFDPQKSYFIEPSQARLRSRSKDLVRHMQDYKASDLKSLMHISDGLAEVNYSRYQNFKKTHKMPSSKPAIYAFNGDVYRGFDVGSLNQKDLDFAQSRLRILSGLYGILKPMDLIQQYRLEMGTKFKQAPFKNLYEFWDTDITKLINKDLKDNDTDLILNLASNEYFKSIKKDKLKGRIIDIHFREYKGSELKFVSFTAKVARGMMANFVIKHKIKTVDKLKSFDYDNYTFEPTLSSETELFFVR